MGGYCKDSDLLELLGYDWYVDNLQYFIEKKDIRNIGPRRIGIILTNLIVIWYSRELKRRFSNTTFLTSYNLAIVGFLLYNLFSNTHHIFIRPLSYLIIFAIPVTAYLLVYLKELGTRKMYVFVIVFFIVVSYLPISIIADHGKGKTDHTNYRFYWYHYKNH